jgi:NodT family efflux transporter outer membrane factor (OMF) lipoprotein
VISQSTFVTCVSFRRSQYELVLFSLLFTLSLTGCIALGPDFEKPEVSTEANWLAKDEALSSEPRVQVEWWKAFNDPVLDTLIQTAYQQNLPLQVAGLRILEARAQLGIAVGNRYPQVQQLHGSANRVEVSEKSPNFIQFADDTYSDHRVAFDAAWELDFWGRFRRSIESAEASLSVSEADYDNTLVILTAEVARAYVTIRTLEEQLALVRSNISLQQESLRIAQVRYDNGATTELDVQQATSTLADTQAQNPVLMTALRQANNGLSVLMGMPPSDLTEMLGGLGPIPVASVSMATGIPADLLRRRPDVRLAENQAAHQSALIGVAKADFYPSFSLTGSIGYQAGDTGRSSTGDLFDSDALFFSAGPSFTWNILNYGRIKNNVRVQDARFQQSVVNYQNTVLTAYQEVEDAMVAFGQSKRESAFRATSAAAAKRSVEISSIQYREGSVDFQRVIDSQRSLVAQQDRWAAARGDIALNLIAMYKALGGGWEIREGNSFISDETRQEMEKRTNWGDLLTPENKAK